jgi:hypothetical protein
MARQGVALRAIARRLTEQGVPTPLRRSSEWSYRTVLGILEHPYYTGAASGWRNAHSKPKRSKSRSGRTSTVHIRPEAEQIALPEGTVPALVDAAVFAFVRDRLKVNKARSSRNTRHPEAALFRAGLARCAYCKAVMRVHIYGKNGQARYRCGADCPDASWVPAQWLDSEVWLFRVEPILRERGRLARALEAIRANDPTEADLQSVDRRLAQAERSLADLTLDLNEVQGRHARKAILERMDDLSKQVDALHDERAAIGARRRGWDAAEGRIEEIEHELGRQLVLDLSVLGFGHKRYVLDRLGITVWVWRRDHEPPFEVEAAIPLDAHEQIIRYVDPRPSSVHTHTTVLSASPVSSSARSSSPSRKSA